MGFNSGFKGLNVVYRPIFSITLTEIVRITSTVSLDKKIHIFVSSLSSSENKREKIKVAFLEHSKPDPWNDKDFQIHTTYFNHTNTK